MSRKVGKEASLLAAGPRDDVAKGASGDQQGIPAVDVYGSGPLEEGGTQPAAAAGAFVVTLATTHAISRSHSSKNAFLET